MVRMVLDHILVEPDPPKENFGQIVIPDTVKKETNEGTVVEVGPGRWLESGKRHAPEVKKGDKVLYDEHTGIVVVIDEVFHRVMREPDILVVLK